METKLTVVVDNVADGELRGEWGLSILVEHRGRTILADAGASELFAENLDKLGFDISAVDYATLSHAHYDHGGGMPKFFQENSKAKFYVRESTKENCYKIEEDYYKYIGIPENMLTDYADRIEIVRGDYTLYDGAWLIPHKTVGLERLGQREKMFQKEGDGWKIDDFSHEQSLVLDTDKGLVIINCCSHGGVGNILREIAETFPDKHIHGIIGGFHLYNKTEGEVMKLVEDIRLSGIEFVCTGHCTMEKAYGILKRELGEKVSQLKVGLKMIF